MFTGIIEELGKIRTISSDKIEIDGNAVLSDLKKGDSIAVNGVCLTAINIDGKSFTANISPETFNITMFHKSKAGDFVNLERAMKLDGRFGGHIVSGHTDCIGIVKFVNKVKNSYIVGIELPSEVIVYLIKKGSITINGISLTIAEVNNNTVEFAVIPHTYENTNLKYLKPDDIVNIEVDMMAKYVEKFLSTGDNRSRIDSNFLHENGWV